MITHTLIDYGYQLMRGPHVIDNRSQTRTLSHYNIIEYWITVNSLYWDVESTSELDLEGASIFLWVPMVLICAFDSWWHTCLREL